MLLLCRKKGLFLVLWRFRVRECRVGRSEGKRQGALSQHSGVSNRALTALGVKEAGGRQDQSTFRIIFEICSGKGSDVRY